MLIDKKSIFEGSTLGVHDTLCCMISFRSDCESSIPGKAKSLNLGCTAIVHPISYIVQLWYVLRICYFVKFTEFENG